MTKEGLDSAEGRAEIRGEEEKVNFNELYAKVVEVMGAPREGQPLYWRKGEWRTAREAWAMLSEEAPRGSEAWAHLSFGARRDVSLDLALVREEKAFLGPVDFVAAQGLPALVEMMGRLAPEEGE